MENVKDEQQKKKGLWGLYVGIIIAVIVLYFVQENNRQAKLNADRANDMAAQAPVGK